MVCNLVYYQVGAYKLKRFISMRQGRYYLEGIVFNYNKPCDHRRKERYFILFYLRGLP